MVSIILTSYNRRAFLREALETLANQDYVGTKQLILCDDGSEDGSLEMAQQFRRDFDDFQIIQEHPTEEQRFKEVRYVKLINQALPLCTERYITYATDDDLYHPERLRQMVEFLETHPEIYLVYHYMKIFRVFVGAGLPRLIELIWDLHHEWNPGTEYWVRNIWNLIDHSSLMHRNLESSDHVAGLESSKSLESSDRVAGPLTRSMDSIRVAGNLPWDDDPKFMRCGDWGFLLRALEAGHRFASIPEYLAIGRKIKGQSLHFDGVESYLKGIGANGRMGENHDT
jgi:glycosyltransferase involved in cell wall biosynthesis